MITKSRLDKCLSTITSICSSPQLEQYLIGYTVLSAGKKGDQYRSPRIGFEHLVVLADKLTQMEALDLERRLQSAIWDKEDEIACKKYHAEEKANGRIFSSAGGSRKGLTAPECSVYMVWWDR